MQLYNESGWANMPSIIDCGCPFVVVLGPRGTGKTYGALRHALSEGRPFMLLRRTQTQCDLVSNPKFTPLTPPARELGIDIAFESAGKNNAAIYRAELDGDKMSKLGEPIGYTAALTTISNVRGFDASSVDLIIYDEFIPERHERPIREEGAAFLNAYETINRNRELEGQRPVTAVLLSNSNSLDSPVLAALGLTDVVDKMLRKRQKYRIMPDRGCAVFLLTDSPISARKAETALYRATSEDSDFYGMAIKNSFGADTYDMVGSRPLAEYAAACVYGDICIYRHKADKTIYCCRTITGRPPRYAETDIDKARFKRERAWLWEAVLQRRVTFCDFYTKQKILDLYTI